MASKTNDKTTTKVTTLKNGQVRVTVYRTLRPCGQQIQEVVKGRDEKTATAGAMHLVDLRTAGHRDRCKAATKISASH